MQDEFQILESRISNEDKILFLQAEGKVIHHIVNNKLRIVIVFQLGNMQRRFPVDARCITSDMGTFFQIEARIALEYVFFRFCKEDAKKQVQLYFEYCDNEGVWYLLPEKLDLDGEYFLLHPKKKSVGYQIFRGAEYLFLTLLLPLWLLDGYFVIRGYKKSPYLDNEKKGKKAIFYHAHGLVKHICGFGYSIREFKTNYFKHKYKHMVKKIKKPELVLFLSERICETGGNLDLIRSQMRSAGISYEEVIDSRPIHKLPFSKIAQTAKLTASAKVIILEDFYPQLGAIDLREETKLIQLWHACGAFKMFGLSEFGKVEHLEQNTRNHRNYSYAFVSGKEMVPFYSEAFGISPDKVLPLGVPRTDIFFDKTYRESVTERLYKKYPVLRDKRVVLFAPTFRGTGNKTAYYPKERFIVDSFMDTMPKDMVLVLKNHPFVKSSFYYSPRLQDRVLDLSEKENINDILFITSLLITDYSSCIFEASLLDIPMLFYVFDLDEYIRERDFYFDFSAFAPGVKVSKFDTLIAETKNILSGEYPHDEKHVSRFKTYFLDALDGHSKERVTEKIKEIYAEQTKS